MKIHLGLILGLIAAVFIGALAPAEAATCDATKSKFMWRRCMSKEVDRLTEAVGAKALDLCSSKITAKGPAAVDERLACRIQTLNETLQGMK